MQTYTDHNEHVREICEDRPERLLEFNVKQGWGPLCEFLGEDVPKDENGEKTAFPRVNDTASFNSYQGMGKYKVARHPLAAINMSIAGIGVIGFISVMKVFVG